MDILLFLLQSIEIIQKTVLKFKVSVLCLTEEFSHWDNDNQTANDPENRFAQTNRHISHFGNEKKYKNSFTNHFSQTANDRDDFLSKSLQSRTEKAKHSQKTVKWQIDIYFQIFHSSLQHI